MRTAKSIQMAVDLSCKHVQAYELFDDVKINRSHRIAVDKLVSLLKSDWSGHFSNNEKKALVWKSVDVELVLNLLNNFNLPQLNFALNSEERSLLSDYINDRKEKELQEWDISIPFITTDKANTPLPYFETAYCRSRKKGKKKSDENIVKVTAKNVVADPEPTDLTYGEVDIEIKASLLKEQFPDNKKSELYLKARTKPLLVIHVFDFFVSDGDSELSNCGEPVLSISLVFPQTNIPAMPKSYAATRRLVEMMEKQRQEVESDEDLDDDE